MFNKEKFKNDFVEKTIEKYGRHPNELTPSELYDILGTMARDIANTNGMYAKSEVEKKNKKQLIYFSMEFLIGKLLSCALYNLGILDSVKEALSELNINYQDIEDAESDAGLGNGGLGRLAACFMDSIASLGLPGHGNCIRYEYGFFRQKIRNGHQDEYPDTWLLDGFPWEIRKPQKAVKVKFYGRPETYLSKDGEIKWRTANAYVVSAVPYDVPVIGYQNKVTNTLRLWYAEPCDDELPVNSSFQSYLKFIRNITHGLYPDDSTEDGKLLRLRQQYFLVSAGMQTAVNNELKQYGTLKNLNEHYVFQLNDTHPILSIPELMRILLDEHDYSWDEAYSIVNKCFAFTNHTVMPEALEKWPCSYINSICPRVYMIIEEINRRNLQYLRSLNLSEGEIYNCSIITNSHVNMCQLAITVAYSVNGVANLHTEILKNQTFKDLYKLYPSKFSNKTNGISHRRFLLVANEKLSSYITELIGDSFIKEPERLQDLMKYSQFNDENIKVFRKINEIKLENKEKLIELVKRENGIDLPKEAIYDVQIKRLHAYKRQLLNIFNIVHLYKKMKVDPNFRIYPHVYIFGAKAAPSYIYAKKIIEFILAVADVINNDPDISRYMKVVFIENYGVSKAQIIIPASDVSEQISLAGKEASGTSNMKFMMNGAITLGTLDGANVEIDKLISSKNDVIFGLKEEEVKKIKFENSYNPWDVYNSDERVRVVIDSLIDGTFSKDLDNFKLIYDEIMYHGDEFMVLKDFDDYLRACKKVETLYLNRDKWGQMALINIAQSGWFSSDRTIEDYNRDIWHLKKIYE